MRRSAPPWSNPRTHGNPPWPQPEGEAQPVEITTPDPAVAHKQRAEQSRADLVRAEQVERERATQLAADTAALAEAEAEALPATTPWSGTRCGTCVTRSSTGRCCTPPPVRRSNVLVVHVRLAEAFAALPEQALKVAATCQAFSLKDCPRRCRPPSSCSNSRPRWTPRRAAWPVWWRWCGHGWRFTGRQTREASFASQWTWTASPSTRPPSRPASSTGTSTSSGCGCTAPPCRRCRRLSCATRSGRRGRWAGRS